MVQPDTRPSLILRLSDPEDDLAWNEFLEIYQPMLMRLASRYGLQDADTREVVQETLVAVAQSIPRFQDKGTRGCFRGWLATITRNKLADYLATKSRHVSGSGDTDVHRWLDQQASPDSRASLWQWQRRQQIFAWAASKVRQQVADRTWQAFYRTCVCGQSAEQVASELDVRVGMVYVSCSRVMARLRKAVELWAGDEESE